MLSISRLCRQCFSGSLVSGSQCWQRSYVAVIYSWEKSMCALNDCENVKANKHVVVRVSIMSKN